MIYYLQVECPYLGVTMSDLPFAKIKKLLALTDSPNVAEASVAMSKVHQLLKEYNLSLSDIKMDNRFSIVEDDYFTFQREKKWRTILVYDVAVANYCSCLRYLHSNGKVVLKIVGKEHNILATRIMLDYLLVTIDRLAQREKVDMRGSYKMGFVNSLGIRLKAMSQTEAIECTALVVQEKSAIDQYFKERGDVKSLAVSYKVHKNGSYDQGYTDGTTVSLNRQVDSQYSDKVRVS